VDGHVNNVTAVAATQGLLFSRTNAIDVQIDQCLNTGLVSNVTAVPSTQGLLFSRVNEIDLQIDQCLNTGLVSNVSAVGTTGLLFTRVNDIDLQFENVRLPIETNAGGKMLHLDSNDAWYIGSKDNYGFSMASGTLSAAHYGLDPADRQYKLQTTTALPIVSQLGYIQSVPASDHHLGTSLGWSTEHKLITDLGFANHNTRLQVYENNSDVNPARFGEGTPSSMNSQSTYIGVNSGNGGDANDQVTAIGYDSGRGANVGTGSTCIGHSAGKNAAGVRLTCIGSFAGHNQTGAYDNFLLGEAAGDGLNGGMNVAIGRYALRGATATSCIAIGTNALGSGYASAAFSGSNRFVVGNNTAQSAKPYVLEATMGSTDATREIYLNADEIYVGSNMPTSYDSSKPLRVWLDNGALRVGP
jgi:hypothetical protein